VKMKNAVFASLLALGVSSSVNAQSYSFSILDGYFAQAMAVNESSQVTGLSAPWGGNVSATVWNGTTATNLDHLWGPGQAYGTAINNTGVVAGFAYTTGNASVHAARWTGTNVTDLGTLGGSGSTANSINNLGQIAGWADTANNSGRHAAIWNGAVVTDLGTLGGGSSSALSINDSGTVVGYSATSANASTHATLWEGTSVIDLGTLGGSWSFANSINNAGQIVGYSSTTGELLTHATLWDGTTIADLGSLAGSNYSNAIAINNFGQSVGYAYATAGNSYSNDVARAVLWNANGVISDLNSVLNADAVSAGWKLDAATDINDNGVIVGIASNKLLGFSSYAYVLTPMSPTAPIPEPETYAMMLAGLGLLGVMARRRKRKLSA
jgi:probable HAF family extracellular repeat protein